MDATDIERTVDHQQKIWTSLYGPARAQTMAAQLTQVLRDRPGISPKEAAAIVDPEDEEDFEDFVATRW